MKINPVQIKILKLMNKKKVVKLLFLICLALFFFPLASLAVPPSTISQKRAQIEEIKKKIKEVESQRELLSEYKVALSNQLEVLNERLALTRLRLDRAQKLLSREENIASQRIRKIYIYGDRGVLDLLLNAQSFSDFITRFYIVSRLLQNDQSIIQKIDNYRQEIQKIEKELLEERKEKDILNEQYLLNLERLNQKEEELRNLLAQANDELKSLYQQMRLAYETALRKAYSTPGHLGPVVERYVTVEPYVNEFYLTNAQFPSKFKATGKTFSVYSSWYGPGFHGRRTSSGEVFNENDFTCAHRTLPFGTFLAVEYKGRKIIVKVNDRGPFIPGRDLDLSKRAAQALGFSGVVKVNFEIVTPLP